MRFDPVEDTLRHWGNTKWTHDDEGEEDKCRDANVAVIQLQARKRANKGSKQNGGLCRDHTVGTRRDNEVGPSS